MKKLFLCITLVLITISMVFAQRVYVAGSLNGQACYWVDGQHTPLPGGSTASAITVVDGKIYAAGDFTDSNYNSRARFWIDGVMTDLHPSTAASSSARGIAVEAGKIYIIGSYQDRNGNSRACYWIDGTRADFPAGTATSGIDVIVADGKVYMLTNDSYWIDGRRNRLSVSDGGTLYLSAFFIENGRVYVTGASDSTGHEGIRLINGYYWIDTTRHNLGYGFSPNNIFVANGMIHIVGEDVSSGFSSTQGQYYLNGDFYDPPPYPRGTTVTSISKTIVIGRTLYITGVYAQDMFNWRSCYWIGDRRFDLPDGAYVYDMTVITE